MTAILTNPRERNRFLRFSVVGIIGAVVDFGVANLLINITRSPLWLAGTISFICAIISNFLWNSYWTYPDSRTKPIIRQLIQFFIVSVAGLIIRIPILKYLEPVIYNIISNLPIDIPVETIKFLSDNITLAVAVIIVMFWNFFINRYWTYSDVK